MIHCSFVFFCTSELYKNAFLMSFLKENRDAISLGLINNNNVGGSRNNLKAQCVN